MKKPSGPLHQDGDSQAMTTAVNQLVELKVKLRRPSPYQLKVGCWNFWPDKETIQRDSQCSAPERGLQAFIQKLQNDNLLA